jgi:hypothetical protein
MSTKNNRPSTYQKLTYLQKVARVNRRLRQGDISFVAEQTGYSATHVCDVLNGNEFNESLVNRAWDIARNRISNAIKIQKLSVPVLG